MNVPTLDHAPHTWFSAGGAAEYNLKFQHNYMTSWPRIKTRYRNLAVTTPQYIPGEKTITGDSPRPRVAEQTQ